MKKRILSAFLALLMLTVMIPASPASAAHSQDSNIVASGFAPDSATARAAIERALEENGIDEPFEIPDGCWNIAYIVLKDALGIGVDNAVGIGYRKDVIGRGRGYYPFTLNNVSSYKNLKQYTANNHVFWFAINTPDNFTCDVGRVEPVSLSKYFSVCKDMKFFLEDPLYLFVTDGTVASFYLCAPDANVISLTKEFRLSRLSFPTENGITYTSPSGEAFNELSKTIGEGSVAQGVNLFVKADDSIDLANIIVARQDGKYFAKSFTVESENYDADSGVYTAPRTAETVVVTPVFSDEPLTYSITTAGEISGGSITVSKNEAATGDKVTVTVEPNDGYKLKSLSYMIGNKATQITADENGEYSFVMPEYDVELNAEFEQITYKLTVTTPENGKVTLEPQQESYAAGEKITITATPNEGYKLKSLTVDGQSFTSGEQFTMPEHDVVVTAEFELATYKINVTAPQNGKINLEPQQESYAAGEKITITATPNEGYKLKSLIVDGQGFESGTQFTMPEHDVEITAEFEQETPPAPTTYKITVTTPENGTITLNPEQESYLAGAKITITATPNEGYKLKSLTVDGQEFESGTQFTMPEHDVEITAEFEQETPPEPPAPATYKINVTAPENGTITLDPEQESYEAGDKITITAIANEGYTLKSLTVDGQSFTSGETFTMPEHDVVVTAEFEQENPPEPPAKSDDVTIKSVSVRGTAATVSGDVFSVELPEGSALPAAEDITVVTNDENAKAVVTGENGKYTITVTAEDGETTHAYTLNVTVKQPATGGGSSGGGNIGGNASSGKEDTTPTEPAPETPVQRFTDVPPTHWAFENINEAAENGWFNGVGNNMFAPNENTTRAQLATVLFRLAGSPATEYTEVFTDVPANEWYSEAIVWANANGIVTGITEDTYAPMRNITREQIATMLCRMQGEPASDVAIRLNFRDGAKISDYAETALAWAYENGIFNGGSDGNLRPTDNATRAEIAAIIARYADAFVTAE